MKINPVYALLAIVGGLLGSAVGAHYQIVLFVIYAVAGVYVSNAVHRNEVFEKNCYLYDTPVLFMIGLLWPIGIFAEFHHFNPTLKRDVQALFPSIRVKFQWPVKIWKVQELPLRKDKGPNPCCESESISL